MNKLNDSGERIVYIEGGAVREPAAGKGRYDLISPIFLHRLAQHYEKLMPDMQDIPTRIKEKNNG